MNRMELFKDTLRYTAAISAAILFSVILKMPEKIFTVLAAVFVMQASPGLIVRQGLQQFILISVSAYWYLTDAGNTEG